MNINSKLFFPFCLFLALFCSCLSGEARDNNSGLGLTTFYPSPDGVFKEIVVENLSLGKSGQTGSGISGTLNFSPRGEPGEGDTGDLYFDSSSKFKYHDGEEWRDLGEGASDGLCGLFYGNRCPAGFELKETKTVMEEEYITATYIWRQDHRGYMNTSYACEPQTIIDPHNPPSAPSSGCFSKRYNKHEAVCGICSGRSSANDVADVYDATGNRVTGYLCGSPHKAYLYRCIYPTDPQRVNLSNEYQVSLCCPVE